MRMCLIQRLLWLAAFLLSLSTAGFAGGPLTPEAVTEQIRLEVAAGARLSPDGEWVAYTTSIAHRDLRFDGQNFTTSGVPASNGGSALQAWVTSTRTGETRPLAENDCCSWGGTWSPDGRSVAFFSDQTGTTALWIWDRTTGKSRRVSNAVVHPYWLTETPVWSRSGESVLCKILPQGMTVADVLKLNLLRKDASGPAKTTPGHPTVHVYQPGPVDSSGAVASGPSADRVADARYLSDLALINVRSGEVTPVARRIRPVWYAFSPDGRTVAFTQHDGWVEATNQPRFSLTVYSLATRSLRRIAEDLRQEFPGYGRRVAWSPDSTRLAFSVQEGNDPRVPAEQTCRMVDVGDGSTVTTASFPSGVGGLIDLGRPLWDREGRWLYVCGGGRLWKMAADPRRLAVMGQSFGGYNTVGLITQTDRFKAAIACSSASNNLFEGYGSFEAGGFDGHAYYETGQGGMGGTPWQFRERYLENSPFFFLDRVTTPLLYERGADDGPGNGNGEVYVGLKRLGKEVEYLVYDGEGHVLSNPANVVDFWNRRLDWLDRHLKPQP